MGKQPHVGMENKKSTTSMQNAPPYLEEPKLTRGERLYTPQNNRRNNINS